MAEELSGVFVSEQTHGSASGFVGQSEIKQK